MKKKLGLHINNSKKIILSISPSMWAWCPIYPMIVQIILSSVEMYNYLMKVFLPKLLFNIESISNLNLLFVYILILMALKTTTPLKNN